MPEKLLLLKPYTDFFIGLINDLFVAPGLEPAYQQVVKVFTMSMLLVLFLGLVSIVLKFIANVLQPATESLARKPEYVLYVIFACLLLLFTSRVNFLVGVATLLVFLGVHIGSSYYLKIPLFGGSAETKAETAQDESASPPPPVAAKPDAPKAASAPAEKKA